MANTLKIKISIAAFAIFVLAIIPLLENKFYTPVTIKRWGKLSWDDFQGIPTPFSSYEAAISSAIYLEYDSSLSRYVAYAGQNNIHSWAKRSRENQEHELNHEQYHFNITQLHACILNDYIERNPYGTEELYRSQLRLINIDLRYMQKRYDDETDHSIIYDKQSRWEYTIDSLLTKEKGLVTDHFSGAQVYFPLLPDSTKGLNDYTRYRSYILRKYGMSLNVLSIQTDGINYKQVANNLREHNSTAPFRLKSFLIDTTEIFKARIISEDTNRYTECSLWVGKGQYLYKVIARFPNNTIDTTGYYQIASSFLNSFRIVDTDPYWLKRFETSNNSIGYHSILKYDYDDTKDKSSRYCMITKEDKQLGFYRGPFYRDDGALFLVYDYLVHFDTLHYKDLLALNKDLYSHTPTSEGQIFFVPAEKIPKENYRINFGYILLQDSAKECYEFYHESLDVTQ